MLALSKRVPESRFGLFIGETWPRAGGNASVDGTSAEAAAVAATTSRVSRTPSAGAATKDVPPPECEARKTRVASTRFGYSATFYSVLCTRTPRGTTDPSKSFVHWAKVRVVLVRCVAVIYGAGLGFTLRVCAYTD